MNGIVVVLQAQEAADDSFQRHGACIKNLERGEFERAVSKGVVRALEHSLRVEANLSINLIAQFERFRIEAEHDDERPDAVAVCMFGPGAERYIDGLINE